MSEAAANYLKLRLARAEEKHRKAVLDDLLEQVEASQAQTDNLRQKMRLAQVGYYNAIHEVQVLEGLRSR